MRRFWLFFSFVILLCCVCSEGDFLGDLLDRQDAIYSIYSSKEMDSKLDCTNLGVGYILSGDKQEAKKVFKNLLGGLYGQSVSFDGTKEGFDRLQAILNVKPIIKEKFDNISCVYGVGDFGAKVSVGGKKVNIQMVYRDGKITIGCPIILGSY